MLKSRAQGRRELKVREVNTRTDRIETHAKDKIKGRSKICETKVAFLHYTVREKIVEEERLKGAG